LKQQDGIVQAAAKLTDRQQQIVELYERGMSQRAIAVYLGVHRTTVRDHLRSVDLKIHKSG